MNENGKLAEVQASAQQRAIKYNLYEFLKKEKRKKKKKCTTYNE
jgi:hypothetical protein